MAHVVAEAPDVAAGRLKDIFRRDPDAFLLCLQMAGLTRNKILTDLRAARKMGSLIVVPSDPRALPRSSAWAAAAEYLIPRLRNVLRHLAKPELTVADAFEAINQATWPGWIRQERAKRSGHAAEGRLATLLRDTGIPFEPRDKADNPLCADALINGVSFDLVIPSVAEPAVVVKSTVHTANIGQFGQSKDHLEVVTARNWIEGRDPKLRKPVLLAFIDGVGFRSNTAGLSGVLRISDHFCQYRTIWKAVVVCGSKLKLPVQVYLPDQYLPDFASFLDEEGFSDIVSGLNAVPKADRPSLIEAGDALIRPLGG
ncbi:hypothetical protein [Roseicella sp. DB1501]|uniref:hypothetical protein n=1 Tax=Roseicella sp. DB1501 TaxID=2730925 RepID=UPI0014923150|nr:hypothetical protein [Roseicella sp. DB1501]NOG74242.1 hypothetical protein [Roseicella sp. DB1501]